MAKSNYIPGFLFIAAVFVCGGAGGFTLREYQVASIKNQDPGVVFGKSVVLDIRSFSNDKASPPTSDFRHQTSDPQLRRLVKAVYDSQIGIRETGMNGGPEVEKYLRYVSLPKGNPWCAAFVCWVLGKAGVSNPRTGWSPALFPDNKVIWVRGESGKVKGESLTNVPTLSPPRRVTGNWQPAYRTGRLVTPTTSDLFGLYFPEKKRIAHVGFIDSWDDKWLITVEGNTNISGDREGDGVYRKRRLVRSIYRVARYINLPGARLENN